VSLTLLSAARVPHERRAELWNLAFSDYATPSHFDAPALEAFERACDLDLAGSCVLLEDDEPVGFAMLGVRAPRGWVGGMGVVPAARRRGHAAHLMNALLDESRRRGLLVLGLEVLTDNAPALTLYRSLGYIARRRLEVWERPAGPAPTPAAPARVVSLDDAARRLGSARLATAPWQRDLSAARRMWSDLAAVAIDVDAAGATAVVRVTPERIGVVEIDATGAGEPACRRALDALLASLLAEQPGRMLRLLNLAEGDAVATSLTGVGAQVTHVQHEMELPVGPRSGDRQ
jgi:ribosomal protein S18 acetylase RimI-like enzyme